MEQFDDVELQILEEPEPRGPRRATRWTLAVVAAALSAGALAAGASALTQSSPPPARKQSAVHLLRTDAPATPCAEHHAAAVRD